MLIPCVVLVYYDFEIIQRSIKCLLRSIDKIDLIIIENKSIFTDTHIKPYILNLLKQKKISQYILFDENISNNAFEIFFDNNLIELEAHDYIILTDGDLLIDADGWISEETDIMQNNTEVFACATSLSIHNLPTENFPDARNWIPPDIEEHCDYVEALTGLHMLLVRTSDFRNYLKYRKKHNLKFVDGTMHDFCYKIINKKWARTKKNVAIHLTWDRYSNLEHPYTRLKFSKTFKEIWYHNLYSTFTIYTQDSIRRIDKID